MRIQHNIAAMSSYRNYTNNVSAVNKNLEKLSSGYKINRAGDDAAGLAISEKMRAQISGLEAASKNAKDGISLVQTAEGALTEVHDMLNRMVTLATQSANGTYDNETDRAQLQKEMDQLKAEIDRIADSSNFNGIKLLDGTMDSTTVSGVEYTKATASEVQKLFVNTDWTGATEDDVIGNKNVLETEGGAKSSAGFQISLDGTTAYLKNGESFNLNIGTETISTDAATADGYLTSSQLASALDGKTVDITGSDGKTHTFTAKADGNVLTFTTEDTADFKLNTQSKVNWTVGTGTNPPAGTGTKAKLEADVGITGGTAADGNTITFSGSGGFQATFKATVANGTTTWDLDTSATTDSYTGYDVSFDGSKLTIEQQTAADLTTNPFGNITTATTISGATVSVDNGNASWTAGEAAPQSLNLVAPHGGTTVGLSDSGSIAAGENGATEIEIVAADSDNGTAAIKATAEAKAQLAGLFDDLEAEDGEEVKVQFADNKWTISVGDQSVEATGTVSDGVLSLKATVGEDTVEVMTISVGDGADTSKADEAAFKTAFGNATGTGLVYTAPAEGGKEPEESTPVNKDIFVAADGLDVATDGDSKLTDISLTSGTAKDLFDGLSDVTAGDNGDLDVKLGDLTFTADDTLKTALKKVSDAFQAAVDEWNAANPTAGYHYEYNGLSTDGTEAGKINLQSATGITALINKVNGNAPTTPNTNTSATSSGTINSGLQNVTDNNSGASAQLANTVVDFSKLNAWQDGAKITIGDTTYTVALGQDSKFANTTNVIDLTDLEKGDANLKTIAAERLTVAAKDNSIFTVGHDGTGNTTLQQKSTVKDTTDMTTKEKVASYLGVSTANPDSLENAKPGSALTLQIGDTSDSYNQLKVSISDCHTEAMGIGSISIATQEGAAAALEAIKSAVNYVSDVRGTLGATQNRLEHTINNLSVMTENIQDAESTIRDTDIAEEMMAYTKNNILVQSAQAMLAQANQIPQGVLQLLG